jgi:hypothetical protein
MRLALLTAALIALAGCAGGPPRVTYIPVPAGYVQLCELPPVGVSNEDLSSAFVQAYQCAKLGNEDKERIIQWQQQLESRLQ